jgi:hypothetical protein
MIIILLVALKYIRRTVAMYTRSRLDYTVAIAIAWTRLGPNSDDYISDDALMAKTVQVELLGIKMPAVSTQLLFSHTVEPVQVREIDGYRIQTANRTMVT